MHLTLPGDQDALIEAVAKANPRTVVVLNTGGGVAMPWLNSVAGLLEMWLPGDSYGPAAARLLFGDADPGGRLPATPSRLTRRKDPLRSRRNIRACSQTTAPWTLLISTKASSSATAIGNKTTRSRSSPSATGSPIPRSR